MSSEMMNQENGVINAANNAASVEQFKETRMRVTTVEALQAEGKEIVYLKFNRDVRVKKAKGGYKPTAHVKNLMQSIKEEGLHTPLYVVPAEVALAEGLELVDADGNDVTDGTNKYVLIDGNNKNEAITLLRATDDAGKASEPIKCLVDEAATNIKQMVMTMNNVVKTWGYADSVKAASVLNKDDEGLAFLKELSDLKFSPSTTSLMLAGRVGVIKKNTLMNYDPELWESCNLGRAKKVFETAKKVGFSIGYIKKRYLHEAIQEGLNKTGDIDKVLKALESFTKEEITEIEKGGDMKAQFRKKLK